MTSRRTKQKRDSKLFEESRNMRFVEAILERLLPELKMLRPSIRRTKHLGSFGGAPDNFEVKFVFLTRADAQRAKENGLVQLAAEKVKLALQNENYPSEAITTFRFYGTSEEEIEDVGGEWMYDRS